MDQGRDLRSLYRRLGHDRGSIAKFLHISERTIRNWEAGNSRIPWATFKLLRLLCRDELPGWDEWRFEAGRLVSPEGYSYGPKDFSWLNLTVRQAKTCTVLYQERNAMRLQVEEAHRQLAMLKTTIAGSEGFVRLVDLVEYGTPLFDLLVDIGKAGLKAEKPVSALARQRLDFRDVLVTRPGSLKNENESHQSPVSDDIVGGAQ